MYRRYRAYEVYSSTILQYSKAMGDSNIAGWCCLGNSYLLTAYINVSSHASTENNNNINTDLCNNQFKRGFYNYSPSLTSYF